MLSNGSFVLGQKQQTVGSVADFNGDKSFSGIVMNAFLVERAISAQEVTALADVQCPTTGSTADQLLQENKFPSLNSWKAGNVSVRTYIYCNDINCNENRHLIGALVYSGDDRLKVLQSEAAPAVRRLQSQN